MRAIILAAGASRRLLPFTAEKPKCLININGGTILDHQLDILNSFGIKDIVIVVGYKKESIYNAVESNWPELQIKFVENPIYDETNTLYSLWLTREYLMEKFLYINADVLCHPDVIGRLLESPNSSCLAVDIKKCGEEEVKVILDGETRIKSIGKELDLSISSGEFIGIGKHGAEGNRRFIEILNSEVEKGNSSKFFEFALDRLIDEFPYQIVDISELPCIEIDFQKDLEEARNVILPKILSMQRGD